MDHPATDETAPERRGWRRPRGLVVELVETLILTLLIFFGIQWFVAQPFRVDQHSMERTFEPGDFVLVDKLSPRWDDYSRGDVVVFQPPEDWTSQPEPYIKRVIGEPGDTIEVREGLVYVNGTRLEEPYLYLGEDGTPEPTEAGDGEQWIVPEGELFVMGDHRMASADSRAFGTIPITSVIGRGALRYWPITKLSLVGSPVYAGVPAP